MSPIEIVRQVYASHASRDTPSLVSILDPEVRWHQAPNHPYANPDGPWVGIDTVVREVVEPINGDWEGFITRVDDLLDAGRHVVAHGAYSGTYRATGRSIEAAMCVIYTVEGAKITEFRQFVDTAQIRWAMGLDAGGLSTPAG